MGCFVMRFFLLPPSFFVRVTECFFFLPGAQLSIQICIWKQVQVLEARLEADTRVLPVSILKGVQQQQLEDHHQDPQTQIQTQPDHTAPTQCCAPTTLFLVLLAGIARRALARRTHMTLRTDAGCIREEQRCGDVAALAGACFPLFVTGIWDLDFPFFI